VRYLIIKNKRLYKLFFKLELKRAQYKAVVYNLQLPFYIRQRAIMALSAISGASSYVSIKQRCLITGKSRSVSNYFKLARIKLRLLISNDYANGIKKDS
jgi:small subunit ribosomal protein S14